MFGLGITAVGESAANDLAKAFGTLARIRIAHPFIISHISGIGLEIANSISKFFSDSKNKSIIDQLLKNGVIITNESYGPVRLSVTPTLSKLISHLAYDLPGLGNKSCDKLATFFGSLDRLLSANVKEVVLVFDSISKEKLIQS